MGLHNKSKGKDYTVIIGCGRLGASLPNTHQQRGIFWLLIKIQILSENYLPIVGLTLTGDATDLMYWKKLR